MHQHLEAITVCFGTAKKLRAAGWAVPSGLVWHEGFNDKVSLTWSDWNPNDPKDARLMNPDYYAPTASDLLAALPTIIDYKKRMYRLRMYKCLELADKHSLSYREVYGIDYQDNSVAADARSWMFARLGVKPKETESTSIAEACAAAWLVLKKYQVIK